MILPDKLYGMDFSKNELATVPLIDVVAKLRVILKIALTRLSLLRQTLRSETFPSHRCRINSSEPLSQIGTPMKNSAIWIGMATGGLIGLFTSIMDSLGLKIVMMSIGVIAGAAIGGAFSRSRKDHRKAMYEVDESHGLGTSPEDRMQNFWRDKGKIVPFSGPPEPEGTNHDFDREHV